MRSETSFTSHEASATGLQISDKRLFRVVVLLASIVFTSAAWAAHPVLTGHTCAGDYNASLSCTSNDIQINDVAQLGTPVEECISGEQVTLDLSLTTKLNATSRYDVVVWFGEVGNNPRAVGGGSCYAAPLPDEPESLFIDFAGNDSDSCPDVTASPEPVTQHFHGVVVECVDNVSPDPNGDDPDDVIMVPDGHLDLFALVTWANNAGTLDCGTNEGEDLTPSINPKCDAALLLDTGVRVQDSATIRVVKNSSGGTSEFFFESDVPGLGDFSLDTTGDNTEATEFVQLNGAEVGVTYSITELEQAGWALTSAICDNGDSPAAVTPLDDQVITCTFNNVALGTVSVTKETIGGDGSFDFITDLPGGNFSRTTTGGTSPAYTVNNVPAGTYSIAETVPTGWDLTSATCDDGSDPASLVVSLGETVACTFVNTARGTIVVEKQTLPDGSGQAFEFSGDAADPGLMDGEQIVVSNLVPGSYDSTETVPEGWDLTSIVCDDGGSLTPSSGNTDTGTANFNLDAGETVTCVFTNRQRGSIEVVKSLAGTGPDVETFGFTSNFNGEFNLTGDDATTGPIEVIPGSGYTVSENNPFDDGWVNTGASCDDGSNPTVGIDVAAGEDVICIFTNTPLGSSTIIKNTVGGNDTFGFSGDEPFGVFELSTTGGTASTADLFDFSLDEGVYEVTEEDLPAGWALTSLGCVEDAEQDSTSSLPDRTATMSVQLAETVTCTFTNTADGTLIIRKNTIPEGDTVNDSFTFTSDASGDIRDYSVFGDELSVSGQPGDYSSAEVVPEGWALTDISCVGQVESFVDIGTGTPGFEPGDTNVEVSLAAGETVVCTFENTKEGSITIAKRTVGDVGSFTFNRSFGDAFPIATVSENTPVSESFTDLLPDSYTVSEVVPDNWTLTDISCEGATNSTVTIGAEGEFDAGDVGVSIDLVDGEDIVCTFTNNAWGSIAVAKETIPDGSLQSFDFTGDAGTPSLTDGQTSTPVMVEAGNYSAMESALAAWDVTSISCDDADSTGNTEAATASFVVGWGEDVVCTFTNTERGTVIVRKQTDPDGGAGFTFTEDMTGTGAFGLDDDGVMTFNNVLPGAYAVTEDDPTPAFDLTGLSCTDGDEGGTDSTTSLVARTASINLDPGETVDCTFTNTERGTVIVRKQTDPDGGAGFTFTEDMTGTGAFGLDDDGVMTFNNVLPGAYAVTEDDPTPAFDLTGLTCTDGGTVSTTNLDTRTASINLDPGETVDCTFTNTERGTVTVVKEAIGFDGEFCFDVVTPEGDGNFCIVTSNGYGEDTEEHLVPGSYGITEIMDGLYVLANASCDDGSTPDDFVLNPGEHLTCTFVNVLPLAVPANNPYALMLMILGMLAAGWYFRPVRRI